MKGQTILITGGTGSFGRKMVEILLREEAPKKVIVFSRDELKQHEMRMAGLDHEALRYFIGDVRDVDRLRRAMTGVDIVMHAAALKQVPACEYNPIEAVLTNVMGARNVIDASLDSGVKRVMAISSDKAVNPINLYGATKLVAEKLFVQANSYRGWGPTRFSCVRYGNVVGSRGSVIPLFREQCKTGRITVTDPEMSRFWLTIETGVRFVIRCIREMEGGEVFVPKVPSMNIRELAETIAGGCKIEYVGIRPGEKLHEVLISEDEAHHTVALEDMFIIQPQHPWWSNGKWNGAERLPRGFRYASNSNSQKLTVAELKRILESTKED